MGEREFKISAKSIDCAGNDCGRQCVRPDIGGVSEPDISGHFSCGP